MTDLSRDLAVYADDEPITGFRHSQLIGKDTIGLYPMPFTLRVWNLSSSDYFLLCAARELSVRHHGSVLYDNEDLKDPSVTDQTDACICIYLSGIQLCTDVSVRT